MKEFIISDVRTETAVLVGLITPEQNERKVKEYLDELAFLADTAGVEAVKRFTYLPGVRVIALCDHEADPGGISV